MKKLITLISLTVSITAYSLPDYQLKNVAIAYSKIIGRCLNTLGLTGVDLNTCISTSITADKSNRVSVMQAQIADLEFVIAGLKANVAEINAYDFTSAASNMETKKVEVACSKDHLKKIHFTNSISPNSISLKGDESCMGLKALLEDYKNTYTAEK